MGLFDWIPTIPEVIDFIDCRIVGHAWKTFIVEGHTVRVCQNCGKQESQ